MNGERVAMGDSGEERGRDLGDSRGHGERVARGNSRKGRERVGDSKKGGQLPETHKHSVMHV